MRALTERCVFTFASKLRRVPGGEEQDQNLV
jgi:hypothetical protein